MMRSAPLAACQQWMREKYFTFGAFSFADPLYFLLKSRAPRKGIMLLITNCDCGLTSVLEDQ
ncbi:hypothetical protein AWC27_09490 [Mycobacterium szulgai]|uniref:Uncharacterized protein n=1 Tax=Mycobacterium szulgai TaxID=1787 RepID=A0A1X2DV34_MYCSZ|nr:hypothetical protein AWC27_09490 [Mycobacterium szulgai]